MAKRKHTSDAYKAMHAYQKTGVKRLVYNAHHGLFLSPGLGKTLIVLEAFNVLRSKQLVGSMLVVAPLRPVYKVWPNEIEKWRYPFDVSIVHGVEKKRTEALERDADVYVTNYENVQWLFDMFIDDPSLCPDMLVLDESSRIKSSQSKRFKVLRSLREAEIFSRTCILTGSPAPNGYEDLWSQVFMLDRGKALGQYVSHYRQRWFVPAGYQGYSWKLMEGAKPEIEDAIKPLITHFPKQILDLPPLVENRIVVELPKKARNYYEELKADMIAEMESATVVSANAATLTNHLRQVANGGIYDEEQQAMHLHNAKSDAVAELVSELGDEPALVGYEFKHDRTRILASLRKAGVPDTRVAWIGGDTSNRNANKAIDAWNDGKLSALVAQVHSVSHGLNLQAGGRHIILHSLVWSLEAYEQLVQRLWRQGQKQSVMLHYIMAEDTVDVIVYKTLQSKNMNQAALLRALKVAA